MGAKTGASTDVPAARVPEASAPAAVERSHAAVTGAIASASVSSDNRASSFAGAETSPELASTGGNASARVRPHQAALAPGERIRVMVVDDSVVIRRLVTETLGGDESIEVVGVAANGQIALTRIPMLNPHVITLDIEMPEMDGLETLKHLRSRHPEIRVIMFSTLTERGAAATLDALTLGASDYVTKASNCGSIGASTKALREELLPKIKSLVPSQTGHSTTARSLHRDAVTAEARSGSITAPAAGRKTATGRTNLVPPQVVVIGVSTGGPNALSVLIPQLPASFPLPILVVQHMPPMFTRLLAERLQTLSALTVREAQEGDEAVPGTVLIAPGDYHMQVTRKGLKSVVTMNQGTPENSCRPAADVLFRSAQECYGGAAIAVVLTGMGQDGLRGTQLLKEAGATVIAQDEESCVVWGMPGFVVRAGLADRVLPIQQIAANLLAMASR